MKKVVLIVIDALATRVVKPALARGDLPNLARIADAGEMVDECISIFPSITPSATASIVTGCYPNRHGIAGAFWYDRNRRKVAYHGDDFWVIVNQGLGTFFQDFLIDLNYKRLTADTLFEHVERAGRKACVLNYMWFRGDVEHEVNAPLLLKLLPGVSFGRRIKGPSICEVADFISTTHSGTGKSFVTSGGLLRRFGFHDETTAEYLLQLGDSGTLPDLTLAYFPNNDFESHSVGAVGALPVLQRIDHHLGEFVVCRGGLDRFLDEAAILITGDHSQSDVSPDRADREVNLTELLSEFQLVPGGADWGEDDQVMLCPNMRSAQIYFRSPSSTERQDQVMETLLQHSGIDQICRITNDTALAEERRYQVITSDRGSLRFHRCAAESAAGLRDAYGNHWICDGDLGAIDADRTGDGHITYDRYPNALERIAASFSEVSGELILTARLGSEFCIDESESHPGGSHGSLHALDSTSPLIFAGAPDDVGLPGTPRIVDVAPLCLDILGLHEISQRMKNEIMAPLH